jgi:two-component system response regulator
MNATLSSRNFLVLLVEDDPDDEALAVRSLRRAAVPLEIVVARDGQEALDLLLDAERPLPHLVLLDLKLPRVNGLEVLRRLRNDARATALPVVLMTSSDEEADMVEAYRNHASSYVQKPVDYEDYILIMSKVVDYWLTVNRLPNRALPLRSGA